MSNGRSTAIIVLLLLFYALVGFMTYRGWRARSEARQLVTQAEQYRSTHNGALAECACDFGADEQHAFYERKSPTRYVVLYFALGATRYDSATGAWRSYYLSAPPP